MGATSSRNRASTDDVAPRSARRGPVRRARHARERRHGGVAGRVVVAQRFGQPGLYLLLARAVARMRRQELRATAAARTLHALPERERSVRIVAGARHEDEPDVIGLGLLRAAVREQYAQLGADAVRGEDRVRARARTEQRTE